MLWLLLLVQLFCLGRGMDTHADAEGRYFTQLYRQNLRQLVGMLNGTVDACEDFYAHACGSVADDVKEPQLVPAYLYNKEDRMHFFEAQRGNFQTLPGRLLTQVYDECKQRREQHVLSTQPRLTQWERLLQELPMLASQAELYAGWPYLSHQWQRLQQSGRYELHWVRLAAQLAAHGVASLLDIYYAENTIYVEPARQLLCPSLTEFEQSLASLLTGRQPQVVRIVAQELRILCRGLRGELPQQPHSRQANEQRLLLDDNNMQYFQAYFAQLNFSEAQLLQARKLPLDVQRIAHMWQLLRRTEPRIVCNYVLWLAQQQLRYEDCYQLTQEFERLLHAEYWAWHVFEPFYGRDVALASYQLHTSRFQQQRRRQVNARDWFGTLWPAQAAERQDPSLSRLLQLHAQRYLNLTALSQHFGELQLIPGAFYGNLLALRRAQLRYSFVSMYADAEDVAQPAYFLRHFLHFCLLSLHRPLYHYYASQGLQLWQQSQLLYSSDGYYTALDCLEQQTLLCYDGHLAPIYRPLGSHEVEEIYRFQRSFEAALRDYQFWLQGESFAFAEDFALQYFGLNSQRVMFYAVAQQLCHRQAALYAAQLNRSYMNLKEFQLAFNCSAEAPMNPAAKCNFS